MKKLFKSNPKIRNQKGDSLISLLVATLIFSAVAMAIMGMLTLNVVESNKLQTRTDNMTAARFGMEKLGRVVRMARNLGDIQGQVPPQGNNYWNAPPGPSDDLSSIQGDSAVTVQQINDGTAANLSAVFPSSVNPFYPAGVLGTVPPDWGPPPYTLGEDTLIIQIPVFDQNGWPRAIPAGTGGFASANMPSLDTYVFRIVPDVQRTQQTGTNFFQLQMSVFPAVVGGSNKPASLQSGTPVTLVSGIIGPLDPNNASRVAAFQYVHRNNEYNLGPTPGPLQTTFAAGSANEGELPNFVGVIANVQLMSMDAARRVSIMPLRTEMYLRNNNQASMVGFPAPNAP